MLAFKIANMLFYASVVLVKCWCSALFCCLEDAPIGPQFMWPVHRFGTWELTRALIKSKCAFYHTTSGIFACL
jgi:hypothetical protein